MYPVPYLLYPWPSSDKIRNHPHANDPTRTMSSQAPTSKASASAVNANDVPTLTSDDSDDAALLECDMSWLDPVENQNNESAAAAPALSSSSTNKRKKGQAVAVHKKKAKATKRVAAAVKSPKRGAKSASGVASKVLSDSELSEKVSADARKAFRAVELSIHKQHPGNFNKIRPKVSFEPFFEFTGACGEHIQKDNARFKAQTISLNGLASNASLYFMAMPGYFEDSCSEHGPCLHWTEMMSFPDWFLRFDKGKQRFNGNYYSNKWSTCPVFPVFVTEMTCDDGSRTYFKYQVPKGLAKQDQESCTTLQEWMDKCFDGFITLRSKKKVQQYFNQFANDFCFPTQDGKVTYQRTIGEFWRFPAFHSVSKLLSLCQMSNKKKELTFGNSWLMMLGLVPHYEQKKKKKKSTKKKSTKK